MPNFNLDAGLKTALFAFFENSRVALFLFNNIFRPADEYPKGPVVTITSFVFAPFLATIFLAEPKREI